MTHHVLIAEGQAELAGRLQRELALEGYAVEVVANGQAALAALRDTPPDVAVIDAALPGIDGMEVTRRVRAANIDIPIIIVTAQGGDGELIAGLDSGADDCLPSSAAVDQLLARLRVQIRRRHPNGADELLRFGTLQLDPLAREVSVGGRPIELTVKEFDLLMLFLLSPHRVLSRNLLYDQVWGYDYGAGSNVLDVHISALRRKLEAGGAPRLIHTVRSIGYILKG